MNQITITVDLTPRNLDILKQLCAPGEVNSFPEAVSPFPEKMTPAEPPKTEPQKEEQKTYSKTDVKAVCLKLSKEGKQDALKAAFAKFGAKKLTEVAESDYPALMEELAHA